MLTSCSFCYIQSLFCIIKLYIHFFTHPVNKNYPLIDFKEL